MLELGLSAGTFNPIHNGHLDVAQSAAETFGLYKVLFIPNADPPHKDIGVLDKEQRWEMVVAATAGNPIFEASRIELDRPGKSYTIDTLRALKQLYGPDVRLNLIIGSDNVESVVHWHDSDEIFDLCRVLIAPRVDVWPQAKLDPSQVFPARATFGHIPMLPISSTQIRDRVSKGRSIRYLVPEAVANIIMAKGHYRQP